MVITKKVGREASVSVSLIFLPHFDDLLLYRRMAKWNLFILSMKKQNVVNSDVICASALTQIIGTNLNTRRIQLITLKDICSKYQGELPNIFQEISV